jgi:hypothetical protein
LRRYRPPLHSTKPETGLSIFAAIDPKSSSTGSEVFLVELLYLGKSAARL